MNKHVILNDSDIQRARAFANKSVSSSVDQYARRHQTDPKQIQRQIEIGKTGEIAAFHWLHSLNFPVSTPDFQLYDAKHKTFTPDMFFFVDGIGQIPLHVKSQDAISAGRFGFSWTFQYSLHTGSDKEIFAPNPKGYVVFVSIATNGAIIQATPYVQTLHSQNLFRDPKLAKLRGIKTVVYLEDLERLTNNERWALIEDFDFSEDL